MTERKVNYKIHKDQNKNFDSSDKKSISSRGNCYWKRRGKKFYLDNKCPWIGVWKSCDTIDYIKCTWQTQSESCDK